MLVTANDLIAGDVLTGSNETLIAIYRFGVSIPSGKCEVVLRKGDKTRRTLFNKRTTIRINREG